MTTTEDDHADDEYADDLKFTQKDWRKLPDGFPAEMIDGRLVKKTAPTVRHQILVGRLFHSLAARAGPARTVLSPVDVYLHLNSVLRPDMLVTERPLARDAEEVGIPVLVLVILSPETNDAAREQNPGIYLRAGVREVWIVDPDAETVEIVTDAGVRSFDRDGAPESEVVLGFAPDLASLFGAADG